MASSNNQNVYVFIQRFYTQKVLVSFRYNKVRFFFTNYVEKQILETVKLVKCVCVFVSVAAVIVENILIFQL